MFHLISKLLHFLSMPITWIVLILAVGLLHKNARKGKRMLWIGFILLYVFSNEFVFNQINRIWEPKMTDIETITQRHPVGVVLGGYSVDAPSSNQVNFMESADRFTVGIQLYHTKRIKKLFFVGGHGQLIHDTDPEGLYSARLAEQMGIPTKDLIVESKSKNTWQNAVNCKRILDSLRIEEPILLITSTTHMPRSLGCFKQVGIDAIPVCVDGVTDEVKWKFDFFFLPNSWVLMSWNRIIHEWIGLVVYKIMGYN